MNTFLTAYLLLYRRFIKHQNLFKDDSKSARRLSVLHLLNDGINVVYITIQIHMRFDVVFMAEDDRLLHALRNTATDAFDPILSKQNIEGTER